MWVCEALVKKRKLIRNGLVKNVILPKDKNIEFQKYNLKIDNSKKEIYFENGKGIFAITDKFGVSEKSEFTLFFAKNQMVIELHKGLLYLEGLDGKVYTLSFRTGKIVEYLGNRDEISWRDYSEMYDFCSFFTQSHYNLDNIAMTEKYVDNLLFTIQSYYYLKDNKLYSCSLNQMSEILGLNVFDFIVFEKKEFESASNMKHTQISPLEKEEVEYFKNNSKRMQDLDKGIDESSLEDDDFDDIERLSSDMHAVDIFNEYTPES